MTEISSVTQQTQIGVETTPGTTVAASKLLQSMGFSWSPQVGNDMFVPAGTKYATVASKGKDWTQLGITGKPVYDEIIYPLSSILGAGVVSTPDVTNAPTARQWVFSPSASQPDAAKTFTLESGNATRAKRAGYGIVTDLNLDIGRESVDLGGSAMAQGVTTGITMTPTPTALPLVPIVGSDFSLYSNATAAALGTTKLLRGFRGNWSVGNKVGGVWPIDQAQASYAAHVEQVPDPTFEFTPMADAAGEAILADLRAGTSRFIRIEALGPNLGGTIRYRLAIDMALKVREVGEYSDEDGVWVLPFTFQLVNDATWGRPMQVTVVNTQAAL